MNGFASTTRILALAWTAACAAVPADPTGPLPPAPPAGPPVPPPPPPPPPAPVYQYGAKFEPPVGRVVHGMGQWAQYNGPYLALLGPAQAPAAELMFISIGDTVRPWNPPLIGQALAAQAAAGRIPSLDLALRGNQPFPAEYDTLTDKLFGIDDEIANSSVWDSRLDDVVQLVKAFGKPVMIRIGGEFNGWWNGYHPYDYPRAFRKIVFMFRAAGADNAAFVWCYEPAAPADFAATDAAGQPKWDPGSDVVDWYSVDLYAKADLSGPPSAHGILTPYGRTLAFLDLAVARQKPVIIAESSPAHYDLASQGAAAWAEWFAPYFQLIAARPEIKWFHYVNYDWTKAGYYALMGWKNNDLSAAPAQAQQYAAELAKPRYLHAGERHLLKDYASFP